MSNIVLKNVCKSYDKEHYAVQDFSLEIPDREFVIFVGPSGCGKSTTLRMIAGLEEITRGELWIDGQLCNYVEAKDRDLSMVFQNYALYPNMTVYENMAFSLKIRKQPKDEVDKKVHEAAKMLGIEHLLDRRPAALSGGQKQRVAIGSAIMRRPKAFLMDEPLSNLDAKLRALHLAMNAKAKRKKMLQKTALVTMNLIVCLFMLFPLLYTISVAFMPSGELYTMAMNIVPKHPTLENFVEAFHKIPLVRFVLNSFLVAGSITLGQIVTCSLAAFAFSFLDFKGKNILFMLVMATMMVPGEATIISNYLTVGSLGLLDTYIVLILPSLTSAMGIFLFRQFYMTFPISLYESAKLDGCGNLRFIVKILMPLTKSAMGAMAVYTFINAWNMYMWPLLVTGSDSKRTVQIGISMLNSVDAQSITLMLAGVVMIIIPSISIFIVGQKALIKGMFSGAVKG